MQLIDETKWWGDNKSLELTAMIFSFTGAFVC